MTFIRVKYRDWIFEVDRQLTKENYDIIIGGGSEGCECNDCKNYLTFRENVFPNEVQNLFNDLGIDYRKEVEILSYETLPNGLHNIGGWFHFIGQVIEGKDCDASLSGGGYTFDLTEIFDNFKIGFTKHISWTLFKNKYNLVQIEFNTSIPWVIDESLETK